ncbi:E3 ubiquitin-protein ligase RING2-like isoform X2 [Daktulosphaira vitifoliae]|uniref:E3 ubiquitin-protein ligase RING2-like isoform X2 n=1 Tax=Daktulosphaira vitifoliae TaxID=58002 RepID=UPI0021AAEAD0|nr:E3 ubiquitin-protein ligase RING2-like isoform X2 [Daktulosphaira vitifoliae]
MFGLHNDAVIIILICFEMTKYLGLPKPDHGKRFCSVCQENKANMKTECGHSFCVKCIYQTIETGITQCPLCKVSLDYLKQIFDRLISKESSNQNENKQQITQSQQHTNEHENNNIHNESSDKEKDHVELTYTNENLPSDNRFGYFANSGNMYDRQTGQIISGYNYESYDSGNDPYNTQNSNAMYKPVPQEPYDENIHRFVNNWFAVDVPQYAEQ